MYERSYGYQYEAQKSLDTSQIAKLIRADIKTAVKEGLLPNTWKYSVRTRTFAGGSAIDVRVKNCADAWQECDGTVPGSKHYYPDGGWTAQSCPNRWCAAHNDPEYAHGAQRHKVLTENARSAQITLERIHDAYNHDGSDIQSDYFDVNYYGSVYFEATGGFQISS